MHSSFQRIAVGCVLAAVTLPPVALAQTAPSPSGSAFLPPPSAPRPNFPFGLSDEVWPFADADTEPMSADLPRFDFFPTSLLWEPKLADKRDPRLSAVWNTADSFFSRTTTDPSIGLTAGVVRFQPAASPDVTWQVDLFAVAHLRFSRFDESIAQDYRAGIPVTFRAGDVVGKIGYEHTSTQLGDELLDSGLRTRRTFERDEIVGGLGYLWRNQLRVYGQSAVSIYQSIPNTTDRWRHDVGCDWYRRETTPSTGQPFAAVNASFDPAVDYRVSMNYQVGWMWRTDGQRLSQFRVYAEFYDGFAMFGQLVDRRERYAGIGVSLDY
jgi:hypothetical protein